MINDNKKRVLRNFFQSPTWEVMKDVLEEYKKSQFYEGSNKRETEFDTLWYFAHKEGGREYLEGFFSHLESLSDDRETK